MTFTPRPQHAPAARVWTAGRAMIFVVLIALLMPTLPARAQDAVFNGRPIREIQIIGLEQIDSRLIENQLRSTVGRPYDQQTVQEDIVRITSLNYFGSALARVAETDDGGVVLTYDLTELPILTGLEIRGNRNIAYFDLRQRILLRVGDPVDPVLIDRAKLALRQAYEEEGYFVTDVSVDQDALERQRRLIFIIREGPRIRLEKLYFEGNTSFREARLRRQIQAKEWSWLLGSSNVINREELTLDVARLKRFYEDRGYLEVQVDRRITVSDNQKKGIVTFIIDEGPQWTVGNIDVRSADGGRLIFTPEQIRLAMEMKTGDLYSQSKLRRSRRNLAELYGRLGYLDGERSRQGLPPRYPRNIDRQFNTETKTIDLRVTIDEGVASTVGKITVRGNSLTRTKVILRELRGITPGRRFDREGFDESQRRLNESALFGNAIITLLGDEADTERDVLVEITERNTGSINFGATVSSDDGLLGAIDITQRNFDITDLPESVDDFFANRAFRGAGQTFNFTLQPGSDNSRYAISLSDPYFLDTNYFFDSSFSFTDADRDRDFDERRTGGRFGIGKRFGDVWSAAGRVRGEVIRISDIEDDGSLDVFAVEGENTVSGVGARVVRNTTDSNLRPSRGSRTTFDVERVGALGGDFNFTRISVNYDKFWTVGEDFLERKSILKFSLNGGYILEPNESPVFERFFAGGQATFRGFEGRGVGPRGIEADSLTPGDEAVGADFRFLVGLEYEFPIYQDFFRGVIFTDQGTLSNDFGLDDWRISIGAGIRLEVPFLSQAPFAIDFAIPIETEEGDQTRTVSFAIDIPFQ